MGSMSSRGRTQARPPAGHARVGEGRANGRRRRSERVLALVARVGVEACAFARCAGDHLPAARNEIDVIGGDGPVNQVRRVERDDLAFEREHGDAARQPVDPRRPRPRRENQRSRTKRAPVAGDDAGRRFGDIDATTPTPFAIVTSGCRSTAWRSAATSLVLSTAPSRGWSSAPFGASSAGSACRTSAPVSQREPCSSVGGRDAADLEQSVEDLERGVELAQRRQEGRKQVQAVAKKFSNLTVALADGWCENTRGRSGSGTGLGRAEQRARGTAARELEGGRQPDDAVADDGCVEMR